MILAAFLGALFGALGGLVIAGVIRECAKDDECGLFNLDAYRRGE